MKTLTPRSRRGHPLVAALMAAGLLTSLPLAAVAGGEADRISELEIKLERSMQMIEKLEAETHKGDGKAALAPGKPDERMDNLER